jgi:hypothetical protein
MVSFGSLATRVPGLMNSHILCLRASDSTNSMNRYQLSMVVRIMANFLVVVAILGSQKW